MPTLRVLLFVLVCVLAGSAAEANNDPRARHDFPGSVHNNGAHLFDVLANDDDPDDDPISLIGPIPDPIHPPDDHATVEKVGSQIRYRANPGFVGTDTFRYRISDGQLFHSAIVTVEVTPNQRPVANPDSANTVQGQWILIDVLHNDGDPDGDALILGGPIDDEVNPPDDHANVATAGQQIRYTPHAGFIGTDKFRYRISDGDLTHSALVTVEVRDAGAPACTPPSISVQPQSVSVTTNSPATFTVTAVGTAELVYQWRRNGSAIPGASFPSLVVPTAEAGVHGTDHTVVVSNDCGTVESDRARLSVTCDGPGDHLINVSNRIVGRPLLCYSPEAYKPGFPVSYSTEEFNTPPLAAALELIENPGRTDGGRDVLGWWIDYLRGELGAFPNWHFGAKEQFSGIYQDYNINTVMAVHFHARRLSRLGGHDARYGQIADLAKRWLKATFAIMATAAIPRPERVANEEYDPVIGGGIETFVALAGPRYRFSTWNRRLRSMIFQRAVAGGSYSGESGEQRRLLDFIQSAWNGFRTGPNALDHSAYGLTGSERGDLAKIKTDSALPVDFVATYLQGIKTYVPYHIIGWHDGTRLTFMPNTPNFNKAPTFAMLYRPGDPILHAVYPYTYPDEHARPMEGFALLDLVNGTVFAEGKTITSEIPRPGVGRLPPESDISFHLVLNSTGAALPNSSGSSSGSGCPPPPATSLLGHWSFEQASDLGWDSSEAGRNGSGVGAPTRVTGRSIGEHALSLDGSSFVRIPGVGEELDSRSAITVTAWGKVPLHSQPNVFRASQPVALHSDRFSVANFIAGGGWSTVVANPSPPVGSWYHLAGVFDHGELRIYVDGQLAGSADAAFTETGSGSTDWSIGARSIGGAGGDQFFIGELDDVRVYSRVLSDEEIAYDAGICP